jgi:hypothetical protein
MKKNVKLKFKWPKESPSTKKAIETLIKDGYVFYSQVEVSIDGVKKGFRLDRLPNATK